MQFHSLRKIKTYTKLQYFERRRAIYTPEVPKSQGQFRPSDQITTRAKHVQSYKATAEKAGYSDAKVLAKVKEFQRAEKAAHKKGEKLDPSPFSASIRGLAQ